MKYLPHPPTPHLSIPDAIPDHPGIFKSKQIYKKKIWFYFFY